MHVLLFEAPPNPRLQRTRFALLRSLLSRKPLGGPAGTESGELVSP